ncbi:MAG: CHASE2 domain-containing protein [Deferrisomatales bacterium]
MKIPPHLARSRPLVAALVGVGVAALLLGLRAHGWLEAAELAAYDRFLRLRPGSAAPPPVVVVTVSDDDIQRLGRWPLTDATVAEALRAVTAQGPRVVGLDIFRDLPVPPGTEELTALWAADPRVVAVSKFGSPGVAPPPSLAGTEQVGFGDVVVDRGGTVRRGLLFLDDGVTVQSSLSLRLALRYLEAEGVFPGPAPGNPEHLQLGATAIAPFEPDDGPYAGADAQGYQFLLDFLDRGSGLAAIGLSDLLAGRAPPGLFRDRVVLIGTTAESVKDDFYTPLSQAGPAGRHEFGVVLHGQIVGQLLRFAAGASAPLRALGDGPESAWIAAWAILGALAGLRSRALRHLAAWAGGGLTALFVPAYGLFLGGWWVPVVPPAAAWLLAAGAVSAYLSAHERRERLVLMSLFSRHVSPEVAAVLWEQRDQFLSGGRPKPQELTATILFSDLKGFTSVSEKLSPPVLVEWLNDYLDAMTRLVMAHEGVVDDYAGDGIKANFGVPIARSDEAAIRRDARNAVACALAMGRELDRLNRQAQERGLPGVRIRIGIFTGPVVAGAIGSAERLKYTTIGDTVNTAARLESYDKALAAEDPCRILVGETTRELLGDTATAHRVGEASLRGRAGVTTVFRVVEADRPPAGRAPQVGPPPKGP